MESPLKTYALLALALAATAFSPVFPATAAYGQRPEGLATAPEPPPGPEVAAAAEKWAVALLGEDWARRSGAILEMDQQTDLARQALRLAAGNSAHPNRYRLLHLLGRYGRMDEAAWLIQLAVKSPMEARAAKGAARSIYSRQVAAVGLADPAKVAVSFSFAAKGAPVPANSPTQGKVVLDAQAFQVLTLEPIPPDTLERMAYLAGRPFNSPDELEREVRKNMAPYLWRRHGKNVMMLAQKDPGRMSVEGRLKITVKNGLSRMVIVKVRPHSWGGEASFTLDNPLLAVPGQESAVLELPAKLAWPKGGQVRVDLAARELGSGQPFPANRLLFPAKPAAD